MSSTPELQIKTSLIKLTNSKEEERDNGANIIEREPNIETETKGSSKSKPNNYHTSKREQNLVG